MAENAVARRGASIALACRAFGVSETCYRYSPKLKDENEEIADLLVGLTRLPQHRHGPARALEHDLAVVPDEGHPVEAAGPGAVDQRHVGVEPGAQPRAEQHHTSRDIELLQSGLNCDRDGNAGDRDEVVSTSMPDSRKCIHLGVDAERTSPAPSGVLGYPCSVEEIVASNLEAVFLDEGGEDVMSVAEQNAAMSGR